MPRIDRHLTNSPDVSAYRDRHEQVQLNANHKSELQPPDQPARLAELVACGELPLPIDLHPDQLEQLARDVRQRRRERLVKFIARAIALDIHRSLEP